MKPVLMVTAHTVYFHKTNIIFTNNECISKSIANTLFKYITYIYSLPRTYITNMHNYNQCKRNCRDQTHSQSLYIL